MPPRNDWKQAISGPKPKPSDEPKEVHEGPVDLIFVSSPEHPWGFSFQQAQVTPRSHEGAETCQQLLHKKMKAVSAPALFPALNPLHPCLLRARR